MPILFERILAAGGHPHVVLTGDDVRAFFEVGSQLVGRPAPVPPLTVKAVHGIRQPDGRRAWYAEPPYVPTDEGLHL